MFWIYLLALAFGGAEHIHNTEVFQVLLPEEVFVQPDGQVYVLNFDEACLRHYNAEGQIVGKIGRKGQGPGEFTYATTVQQIGQHFYIQDELTGLVSVFDLEGKLVRQLKLPKRPLIARKTLNGWCYYGYNYDSLEGASSALIFSDSDFQKPKAIQGIPSTGWRTPGIGVLSDDTGFKATLTPIAICPQLAVSPDGSRIYFADPEKFLINVYSGQSGERLYVLEDHSKRLPFDKAQADAENAEALRTFRSEHPGASMKILYPESYPAIRALAFDPDGKLVVDRWRARRDVYDPLVFDDKGQISTTTYSWTILKRLCGIAQGHAYVSVFDGEEAVIAKVPLKELANFTETHPIKDWSHARNFFIGN